MRINVSACGMQRMLLEKDVLLIPYYLKERYNADVYFIYPLTDRNKDLPSKYRGVNLIPLTFKSDDQNFSFRGEWYFFWYIFRNATDIDVLMRYHFSYQTAIIGIIYKLRNPKGIFYIKGDGYGVFTSLFRDNSRKIIRVKNYFIEKILTLMCDFSDKVSVETPSLLNYFKKNKAFVSCPEKLVLMLNGFDENLFKSLNMQELSFAEKENIILASGRIGAKDKNIELLLNVAEKLELGDWSIVLVGPIEKEECDFQKHINEYFLRNPELKTKIIFTGAIYDRREYWNWFNRSKVFVHMAPAESYGIVFTEAYRFKNYIVSTDVGIASELIKRGAGELYPINDSEKLKLCLQRIINKDTDLEEIYRYKEIDSHSISWSNEILNLNLLKNR